MSCSLSAPAMLSAVDSWLSACQRTSGTSGVYESAVVDQKNILMARFRGMVVTVSQATQAMAMLGQSAHFKGDALADLCRELSTHMVPDGDSNQVGSKERRRLQDYSNFLGFLTATAWRRLLNPGASPSSKLNLLGDFLAQLGLTNPSEGTVRSVASLLVLLHEADFDTPAKKHELFQLAKDFLRRSCLQYVKFAADKVQLLELPLAWEDLPQSWKDLAYKTEQPAVEIPVDVSAFRAMQVSIPMRSTHKELVVNTQADLLAFLGQKLQTSVLRGAAGKNSKLMECAQTIGKDVAEKQGPGSRKILLGLASPQKKAAAAKVDLAPIGADAALSDPAFLSASSSDSLVSSMPDAASLPSAAARRLPVLGSLVSTSTLESLPEEQDPVESAKKVADTSLLTVGRSLGEELKAARKVRGERMPVQVFRRIRGKQSPAAAGCVPQSVSVASAAASTRGMKRRAADACAVPVRALAVTAGSEPSSATSIEPAKEAACEHKIVKAVRKVSHEQKRPSRNCVASKAYHNCRNRLIRRGISKEKASVAARKAYRTASKRYHKRH